MKKVVRLTESDLVRLVKKIIKEQEQEEDEFMPDSDNECEQLHHDLYSIYDDYFKYIENNFSEDMGKDEALEIFKGFENESLHTIRMADEYDCDKLLRYGNLEDDYYEYVQDILDRLGLTHDDFY